jgi:hypothetical protein
MKNPAAMRMALCLVLALPLAAYAQQEALPEGTQSMYLSKWYDEHGQLMSSIVYRGQKMADGVYVSVIAWRDG